MGPYIDLLLHQSRHRPEPTYVPAGNYVVAGPYLAFASTMKITGTSWHFAPDSCIDVLSATAKWSTIFSIMDDGPRSNLLLIPLNLKEPIFCIPYMDLHRKL